MLKLYSVYDRISAKYNYPFIAINEAVAMRLLQRSLTNPNNQLTNFAEDYELYAVAEYDDNTANFKNNIERIKICSLSDLLPKNKSLLTINGEKNGEPLHLDKTGNDNTGVSEQVEEGRSSGTNKKSKKSGKGGK